MRKSYPEMVSSRDSYREIVWRLKPEASALLTLYSASSAWCVATSWSATSITARICRGRAPRLLTSHPTAPSAFSPRLCLFREPDAGNPPDEREEETELSPTGLRRRGESPAHRHREATVTAPLLDSTLTPFQANKRRKLVQTRDYNSRQETCRVRMLRE